MSGALLCETCRELLNGTESVTHVITPVGTIPVIAYIIIIFYLFFGFFGACFISELKTKR
jgi:hypothetical protein